MINTFPILSPGYHFVVKCFLELIPFHPGQNFHYRMLGLGAHYKPSEPYDFVVPCDVVQKQIVAVEFCKAIYIYIYIPFVSIPTLDDGPRCILEVDRTQTNPDLFGREASGSFKGGSDGKFYYLLCMISDSIKNHTYLMDSDIIHIISYLLCMIWSI